MNCDAIAPYYQTLERLVFGSALERCRTYFLPELREAKNALVVGDGDGRFLRRLLDTSPEVRTFYVDRSLKMLEAARSRAGEDRVRYLCADAELSLPVARFDWVAAHFFFDCFDGPALGRVVQRMRQAAPDARWLVSEFRVPRGTIAGLAGRALIALMYRFFGLAANLKTQRLEDHRPALEAAGLRMEKAREWAGGLIVSEVWAVDAGADG